MIEIDYSSIQRIFSALEVLSPQLNAARDELSSVVTGINARLKTFNFGVAAWVVTSQGKDTKSEIGYAKHANNWGILLRQTKGDEITTWHYNDAPTWLRVDRVSSIPDLLSHLAAQVCVTIDLIQKKVPQARGILQAVGGVDADQGST